MTFKTRELTVDLVNEISTNEIRFSQGDENSAKLVLNITNQGQELDLSKATAVRITFEKSDRKTVFQQDCQVINAMKGKYQIVLKTQTLAAIGNVYGQVQIIEGDQKIDSQLFVFTVKRSLSSNEAVESKNEFSIIQRALEVGEQFKGVDFAPIIAAGALAQGALPKAGGKMTGNIEFDASTTEKRIFHKGAVEHFGYLFNSKTTGIYNWRVDKFGISYNAETDTFTVGANNTNLMKKTGDTITGTTTITYPFRVASTDGTKSINMEMDSNGKFWLGQLLPTARNVVAIDPDGTFNVLGNTNLLKKTGDKMSGDLNLDRTGTASRDIGWTKDGVTQTNLGMNSSNKLRLYDNVNAITALDYDTATKTFNVYSPNTNLVTKTKDGPATLTLTADATISDASYPPIAHRRGNAVTVRIAVSRNNGSTSSIVTTLPTDMRPTLDISQTCIATDGTAVQTTITAATGEIKFFTTGKNVFSTYTFVTN
ncbi:BppU family phage baseplate upper protein [Bacillus sp. RIT 809]|uniref:BppU family phage baseplate upper protein n=1 Tax=Bacillus sp. RIT 809 TaxID=2803857 RepID=UPI00194FFAE7|nr:BppU family phage baseplate upper protein [Bacillus sp. RIT 809]MBM6649000.1 BppU family phage baseplate upper protein [Bacillus sp. RIT 809]